jgi:DNA-binding transcriptional LysR family regulator
MVISAIQLMNLQTLDLNLLLVFEALMDERNVTRAAKRVGLSQPAMSNALARLRRTFDDPVLVRTPDGMLPTPRAQALIVPVRTALAQLRGALEERPAFDPAASQRIFHLLANDYVELLLLPQVSAELQQQAQEVKLHVYRPRNLFHPPTAIDLADSFDLALGFFPDALTLESEIRSAVLWEERNVCLARTNHPAIRGEITLQQYAAAQHVAVFYKAQGAGLIDTLLEQQGLARRVALLVPHFVSAPFVVAASDLIATVPKRLAQRFVELSLQVLPVPLEMPPFRLTLLWHERFDHDAAHTWLRELLLTTAAKVGQLI